MNPITYLAIYLPIKIQPVYNIYLYFSEREKPNHEKQRLAAAGKLFCIHKKKI